jgi:hypothetical protein
MIKGLINRLPLRVSSGPFQGTRCLFTSSGDGVVAKLAGTYDMEIHPAFEHALAKSPALVVDIGSAEGFYVSAFALALPHARVLAYEAKEEWRSRTRRLAELNGVAGRCEVRGFCDREEFRRLLLETRDLPKFILMDIEGGEFDLLSEESCSLLGRTELIVELHESKSRNPGEELVRTLLPTHDVSVVWARGERRPSDVGHILWRCAAVLCPPLCRRLGERRAHRMRWLHAIPKKLT